MTLTDTATRKEFAGIAGFKPSYITQLEKDNRLVLTEDGKRILVAESLARIEATRDPSKIAVARRHAEARSAAEGEGNAQAAPETEELEINSSGYQHWRERSERAKALAAERDNAVADGKLLAAADVAAAVATIATTLRTRLESLPAILAPQVVAAVDEARAHALIAEHVEHALAESERQLANLAKAA